MASLFLYSKLILLLLLLATWKNLSMPADVGSRNTSKVSAACHLKVMLKYMLSRKQKIPLFNEDFLLFSQL